jgi:hypothetical protein
LVHCFWSDLDALLVKREEIPGLAMVTVSQNPFGHREVGLMKIEDTPACSTRRERILAGIGLKHEPPVVVTSLQ